MNTPFTPLLLILFFILTVFPKITAEADPIINDDFATFTKIDNPWTCVDNQDQIKVIAGTQLVVDDSGQIQESPLSPSIAVGDLNGDGLPDLVIADCWGFFWYFQNHGTKSVPKFTTAEVMPIWLGDPCPNLWDQFGLVTHNVAPHIQLIDYDGDGKLDLVVGNYLGKLFYLHNEGTSTTPQFKTPKNLDNITIATHHEGVLWCNYLAPCLYDWQSNGHLDLIVGDGTYSANSIFFIHNKGTTDQPAFTEENMTKIIPGMGREHLAPQVISWNGDGKADVLSIEREGYLNIFLNKGNAPNSGYPTFDDGHHVLLGGQEKLNENSSVTMARLSDEGLPGLVIGTADGHVYYSQNTGTSNDFQFSAPAALLGTSALPQILKPTNWKLDGGYGSPYDLLVCTNAQVEPGFTPPPDSSAGNALRFYIDEPAQPNPTFPNHFYPVMDRREIARINAVTLTAETSYKLSFWIRTDGTISDLKYRIWTLTQDANRNDEQINMIDSVDSSSGWIHFTKSIRFRSITDDEHVTLPFQFTWNFTGKGSIYIAALRLEQDQ